jgi:thiol-disulfide isomerase/thioredoxin
MFISGCNSKNNTDTDKSTVLSLTNDSGTFQIKDIDGRSSALQLDKGYLAVRRVKQPVIIVYLFSTYDESCRAMLPYLSDLQHKRSKELFVLGIIIPEHISDNKLRDYMLRNNTTFFISDSDDSRHIASALTNMLKLGSNYPLPLTIIFYKGKYVVHYEGITPIEMIYNDLHSLDPKTTRNK